MKAKKLRKPDPEMPPPEMTGAQAQALLDAAEKSIRGIAKELGVDVRTMRKFVNGGLAINRRTAIAIRCVCEHQHLAHSTPKE